MGKWSKDVVFGGIGNRVESNGVVVDQRSDGTYVNGSKVGDSDASIEIVDGRVYVDGQDDY